MTADTRFTLASEQMLFIYADRCEIRSRLSGDVFSLNYFLVAKNLQSCLSHMGKKNHVKIKSVREKLFEKQSHQNIYMYLYILKKYLYIIFQYSSGENAFIFTVNDGVKVK